MSGRNNQRHDIGIAEGRFDLLLLQLRLTLIQRINVILAEYIRAFIGKIAAENDGHHENRHQQRIDFRDNLTPAIDIRDKLPVVGPVNPFAEKHQKTGHQGKYHDHAEDNRLNQHAAQVEADLEMHEHHG